MLRFMSRNPDGGKQTVIAVMEVSVNSLTVIKLLNMEVDDDTKEVGT